MTRFLHPRRSLWPHLACLAWAAFTLWLSPPVHAVEPDEVLQDPALEARADNIGRHLRCLVCQSQSIEESDAGLAKDLRILVRERLKAGDTDEQIFDFIQSRYGDFVLMKPPLETKTYLLWGTPILLLAAGLFAYIVTVRRSSGLTPAGPAPEKLSGQEQAELDKILSGDGEGK